MNNLIKTLIKPDWDDDPKRTEILSAANLIQVGEFQLIQLAYKVWFQKDLPENKINKIFEEYMITGIIPIWVTYYAKDIIKLDNANKLNGYDEKYHIYDHEFGGYIYNDNERKWRGIQYTIIIIFVFIASHNSVETISFNIINNFLVLCSYNHISNIGLFCFFRYM